MNTDGFADTQIQFIAHARAGYWYKGKIMSLYTTYKHRHHSYWNSSMYPLFMVDPDKLRIEPSIIVTLPAHGSTG